MRLRRAWVSERIREAADSRVVVEVMVGAGGFGSSADILGGGG